MHDVPIESLVSASILKQQNIDRDEIKQDLKADAEKAKETIRQETERLTTSDQKDEKSSPVKDLEQKDGKLSPAKDLDQKDGKSSPAKDLEKKDGKSSPVEDKEKTKKELLAQREDFERRLADLKAGHAPQIAINYDVEKLNGPGGHYLPGEGKIAIDLGTVKGEYVDITEETALQHEFNHAVQFNTLIETKDGEKFEPVYVPMSMEQEYKVAQAIEIGSNISEVLYIREEYRSKKYLTNYYKEKVDEGLSDLMQHKKLNTSQVSELKMALNENHGCKVDSINWSSGTISYTYGKEKKTIEVGKDVAKNIDYYLDKKDSEKSFWGNESYNEKFGWYLEGIRKGTYNPLSDEPDEKELKDIGKKCAEGWIKEYSKGYDKQCRNYVSVAFRCNDFEDIKPNKDNYNKTLSSILTVGGYDFSSAVEDKLTCPEDVKEIDEKIKKGTNEIDIINADKEKPEKERMNLGWKISNASPEAEVAHSLAKGLKVKKQKDLSSDVTDEEKAIYKQAAKELGYNDNELNYESVKDRLIDIQRGTSGEYCGRHITPNQETLDAQLKKLIKTEEEYDGVRVNDFTEPYLNKEARLKRCKEIEAAIKRIDEKLNPEKSSAETVASYAPTKEAQNLTEQAKGDKNNFNPLVAACSADRGR